MLNGGPISWSVSLQQTTSSSPAESEYKALHHATLEVIWLRILLDEMGYAQQQSTTILDDSTAAMNATKNPVNHSKPLPPSRFRYLRDKMVITPKTHKKTKK